MPEPAAAPPTVISPGGPPLNPPIGMPPGGPEAAAPPASAPPAAADSPPSDGGAMAIPPPDAPPESAAAAPAPPPASAAGSSPPPQPDSNVPVNSSNTAARRRNTVRLEQKHNGEGRYGGTLRISENKRRTRTGHLGRPYHGRNLQNLHLISPCNLRFRPPGCKLGKHFERANFRRNCPNQRSGNPEHLPVSRPQLCSKSGIPPDSPENAS